MTVAQDVERRALTGIELRKDGDDDALPKIVGYAAVFDKMSERMFGMIEKISKGAFKSAMDRPDDVRALVGHVPEMILGRSSAKTLSMKEDDVGLRVEIDTPDTQLGRDTVESIKRGDLDGMSFAFKVIKETWEETEGESIRTIEDVELLDVSVVTYPAYPDTSVAVRSLEKWKAARDDVDGSTLIDSDIARARMRLAESSCRSQGE